MKKILILIGVVVVAVILIGKSRLGVFSSKSPASNSNPVATGNVNDVYTTLVQDSSVEATIFADETSDADLVGEDDQAISDFGQSYDENTF